MAKVSPFTVTPPSLLSLHNTLGSIALAIQCRDTSLAISPVQSSEGQHHLKLKGHAMKIVHCFRSLLILGLFLTTLTGCAQGAKAATHRSQPLPLPRGRRRHSPGIRFRITRVCLLCALRKTVFRTAWILQLRRFAVCLLPFRDDHRLEPNTQYYFSVSSYNGLSSPCSNEVSTVTPASQA